MASVASVGLSCQRCVPHFIENRYKAYELRKYDNTQVMLLEDFGGESLKILWSGRPFALPNFLHLAIQITDALGKVHQKNVIHKDINPSNIVLNPQTGQLKIIDFGLSIAVLKRGEVCPMPYAHGGLCPMPMSTSYESSKGYTILSQENPSLKSPHLLEGTFAYMSPKQTGRMN